MNPKTKSATTQNFVPVRDVKGNMVILKDGRLNGIMLASSINFALKSLDEQEAILSHFQSFLNTLDFSVQFYVQSRRLDITPYLKKLDALMPKQSNDLMRIQLREYMGFIKSFTEEVDVMSKNFFVVVPYTPTEINLKANLGSFFGGKKDLQIDEQKFQEHQTQLEQRMALVEQGLGRIGVRTVVLRDEELVELYYHIFNPGEKMSEMKQYK